MRRKKGGEKGSSLKHAGAAASQCRLNDLPRVLYCALACFRDHLESISAHFHLPFLLAFNCLIVWIGGGLVKNSLKLLKDAFSVDSTLTLAG